VILKVPEENISYSDEPHNPGAFLQRQARMYSRFAPWYDLAVKILPLWKNWILSVLPHIQGARVLEVSPGTGYLLSTYAGKYQTHALDYNPDMIHVTRKNLRKNNLSANIIQADACGLPYPDASFDSVINTMSFTAYPDGEMAMAEFHRVLAENGVLLLVDYDYPANRNRVGVALTRLMASAGDIIRDLSQLLDWAGFEFEEREIGGFGSVHFFIAHKRD